MKLNKTQRIIDNIPQQITIKNYKIIFGSTNVIIEKLYDVYDMMLGNFYAHYMLISFPYLMIFLIIIQLLLSIYSINWGKPHHKYRMFGP